MLILKVYLVQTQASQQVLSKFVVMIVIDLVSIKAVAKLELLFTKMSLKMVLLDIQV